MTDEQTTIEEESISTGIVDSPALDAEVAPQDPEVEPMAAEAPAASGRPERKSRQGIVTSSSMQKTVVVRVDRKVRHAMYGRTVSRSSKFKAHDEHNECGIGDRVEIRETRPLSKEKRWRVARILERAK